jgi:hypothetical protein
MTLQLRIIAAVLIIGGVLFAGLAVYAINQRSATTDDIQTSRIASSAESCDAATANNERAHRKLTTLFAKAEKATPQKKTELEVSLGAFLGIVNALQPPTTHAQCERLGHQRVRLRR